MFEDLSRAELAAIVLRQEEIIEGQEETIEAQRDSIYRMGGALIEFGCEPEDVLDAYAPVVGGGDEDKDLEDDTPS